MKGEAVSLSVVGIPRRISGKGAGCSILLPNFLRRRRLENLDIIGMTLRQQIDQDFKEALKSKDEARVSTLRMLLAAIKTKEVEKRTKLSKTEPLEKLEKLSKLTDEEIVGVIASEIKKRKEAAEQYEKGGRPELAEKEEREIEILSGYLPEQLGEDEIRKLVKEAIAKVMAQGPPAMGKVMGVLMPQVKGKADGGVVNKVVREELGK